MAILIILFFVAFIGAIVYEYKPKGLFEQMQEYLEQCEKENNN